MSTGAVKHGPTLPMTGAPIRSALLTLDATVRSSCPTARLAWQRMTAVESPRDGLEPLLSVKELAVYLGISESSIYRLLRAGDLAGVKVGGRTLFERREVREFIEASRRRVPGDRSLPTETTEEA
jgi:excisionase family DNA binding protein